MPSTSKSVLAILPKISGRTIKKEKRAAFSRSIPNNTAVAIVDPLLEIPGRIAMAYTKPKITAFFDETILSVFLALSAQNKMIAVRQSIAPTKTKF